MLKVKSINIAILLFLLIGITSSCGDSGQSKEDLHRHPAQQQEIPEVVVLSSPEDLIKQTDQNETSRSGRGQIAGASGIRWVSLAQAMQMIKGRDKNLKAILYFTTTGTCQECKVIEQQVFSNPEVMERSSRWVFVKINIDIDKEVAKNYKVTSVPAFKALDNFGNAYKTHICETDGSVDAARFAQMLFEWY